MGRSMQVESVQRTMVSVTKNTRASTKHHKIINNKSKFSNYGLWNRFFSSSSSSFPSSNSSSSSSSFRLTTRWIKFYDFSQHKLQRNDSFVVFVVKLLKTQIKQDAVRALQFFVHLSSLSLSLFQSHEHAGCERAQKNIGNFVRELVRDESHFHHRRSTSAYDKISVPIVRWPNKAAHMGNRDEKERNIIFTEKDVAIGLFGGP